MAAPESLPEPSEGADHAVSLAEARARLADLLQRADDTGPVEVRSATGELLGVLVAPGDWRLYRQLEDERDHQLIEQARDEPGEPIPWEQVKAELGL